MKMVKINKILLLLLLLPYYSHAQIDDGPLIITAMEDPPIFKGDVIDFIQSQLNYPENAKKDKIEGTVYISFWVDIDGITIDHEIIRGVREDIDSEAMRIAKMIVCEKAATQRGKPIKVRFTIPFKFELPETKALKEREDLTKKKRKRLFNKTKNKINHEKRND